MAVITVPVLVATAIAGTSFGAWIGSQADDAIEVLTGEKGGIPWLGLALVGGIAIFAYSVVKK